MASNDSTDVLIIDDEEHFSEGCRQTLELGGYKAAIARDGFQGLELVQALRPGVALIDLKMPGLDGLEVLNRVSKIDPSTVGIIVSGHGTVDSAVESMKIGAFDFLTKPFEPEALLEAVRRGISLHTLKRENKSAQTGPIESRSTDKNDLLLHGLDFLGECYSAGLGKNQILEELAYLESEARYHAKSLGQVKKKEKAILDLRNDLYFTDGLLQKYEFRKNALIQILLDVQEHFHWLPKPVLNWISGRLNIPMREIHTIANFYGAFSLEPRGEHTVHVCTGTACHVRGAPEVLARVSAVLGVNPGETDRDQRFTLETVGCLGCCALAPVVKVDDHYHRNPSIKKLQNMVDSFEKKGEGKCQN